MNRPVELKVKTRPQLALESYLDALLQDATEEEQPILVLEPALAPESTLDEFQLAVLEEQARDAKLVAAPVAVPIGWDALADVESAQRWTIRDADELLERAASAELRGWGFARQSLPDA